MKYTFELTISGCNTRCRHCYVEGGPDKNIRLDDFFYCIEKIKPVLDRLDGSIAFTTGNERYNHPQIVKIITAVQQSLPEYSSLCTDFDNPTTAIALLQRKDKGRILVC